MSELQKEASAAGVLAFRYKKIKAIFDELPARFKYLDLIKLAGIKDSPNVRSGIARILERDFKCINVRSCWKKT